MSSSCLSKALKSRWDYPSHPSIHLVWKSLRRTQNNFPSKLSPLSSHATNFCDLSNERINDIIELELKKIECNLFIRLHNLLTRFANGSTQICSILLKLTNKKPLSTGIPAIVHCSVCTTHRLSYYYSVFLLVSEAKVLVHNKPITTNPDKPNSLL